MKEYEFEQNFVKAVNQAGGLCWKLAASSPGCSGVPDRLVILPTNKFGLVELKRPFADQKPRPNQIERLEEALKITDHVYVLDNPLKMNDVIEDINSDAHPETRYGYEKGSPSWYRKLMSDLNKMVEIFG